MTERHAAHRQFVRFAVVGFACFVLTLATFTILDRSGAHYLVAGVAGYAAGIVLGFVLNRSWTFEATGRPARTQAARFLVVSGIGIALNALLLKLFVDGLETPNTAGEIVAVALTAPVTFAINRAWSFA
jgi:putative flippase GtrA